MSPKTPHSKVNDFLQVYVENAYESVQLQHDKLILKWVVLQEDLGPFPRGFLVREMCIRYLDMMVVIYTPKKKTKDKDTKGFQYSFWQDSVLKYWQKPQENLRQKSTTC